MTTPLPPDLAVRFDEARANVDAFAQRHFSLRGTIRLHRAALGWDLLRAPVNVVLAIPNVLLRLAALCLRALRLGHAADWVDRHPLVLRTAVAAEVERLVQNELLGPLTADRQVADYSGTRAAVAEMTASLGTLGAGAVLFNAVTPGVISLAPAFALSLAKAAAIAAFPLGGMLGSVWFGTFGVEPSLMLTISVALGLAAAISVIATFAGLLADPVQLALGIHQRRLRRLIDALRAEAESPGAGRFAAREHYLARVWDLADILAGLVRHLRF